jgi:hypothetical protein
MPTIELPDKRRMILDLLEEYWAQHPELRLGQIIETANSLGGNEVSSVFYARDHTLLTGLNKLTMLDAKV